MPPCPKCGESFDAAEVFVRYTLTGCRTYIECPRCDAELMVEITVSEHS